MIIPVALAAALRACAPASAPDTIAAIVEVESGGWPYAINDNTARRSYRPGSRAEALRIADAALSARHSVDVGIAQVNSSNFRAFNVNAATMLEPCANLRVGSAILAGAYRVAAARYSGRPQALWHAIMAYNSGSIYAGEGYVRSVVETASPPSPVVPSIGIITPSTVAEEPLLPPAEIIPQAPRSRPPRQRVVDPRQAPLRVSGRWGDLRRSGIAHTLALQIDRRS
jgi:type IV secretion system protein VirB1